MTEIIERTRICDECSSDLTTTIAYGGWHYELTTEWTPQVNPWRPVTTPGPTKPYTKHFCNASCLIAYLAKKEAKRSSIECPKPNGDWLFITTV